MITKVRKPICPRLYEVVGPGLGRQYLLWLAIIILCSCSNKSVTIKGIAKDGNAGKKVLFTTAGIENTIEEVTVDSNNEFIVQVETLKAGYYKIDGEVLFLAPGFDLKIDMSREPVKFTGDGAKENTLLHLKLDKEKEYSYLSESNEEKYALKVDDFKKYLAEFTTWSDKRLSAPALNQDFVVVEKRKSDALVRSTMLDYAGKHGRNRDIESQINKILEENAPDFKKEGSFEKVTSLLALSRKDMLPRELQDEIKSAVLSDFNWNDEYLYKNSIGHWHLLKRKISQAMEKVSVDIREQAGRRIPNELVKRNVVRDSIQSDLIRNDLFAIYTSRVIKSRPSYAEEVYSEFVATNPSKKYLDEVNKSYNNYKGTAKGAISPKFTGYQKPDGSTVNLDDLLGKYVYIDVWATWCGPCKKEIPFLKKVEKQYHGKNIEFVSISVDKEKDRQKWKAMVAKKQLTGIQLMADKDFDSEFISAYNVIGIPQFILIDPKGYIVDSDAPRPSDEKLIALFDELKI